MNLLRLECDAFVIDVLVITSKTGKGFQHYVSQNDYIILT